MFYFQFVEFLDVVSFNFAVVFALCLCFIVIYVLRLCWAFSFFGLQGCQFQLEREKPGLCRRDIIRLMTLSYFPFDQRRNPIGKVELGQVDCVVELCQFHEFTCISFSLSLSLYCRVIPLKSRAIKRLCFCECSSRSSAACPYKYFPLISF